MPAVRRPGSPRRSHRLARAIALALPLAGLASCGGGGSDSSTGPQPVVASISAAAGDGQTARIGSAVATAPAVLVRDQNGNAMANVHVTFTVAAGGGSVAGGAVTTNASGIATAGAWTLGTAVGANALTATASGGSNPSTQLTATARLPRWTVMVYMAADNTLATAGVLDIDEMEAAGANPEVQVVVQAEFSPAAFEAEGCTPQTCSNRTNYNTFRYAVSGQGTEVYGPNGATTDIGNRNMTDPAQLHEFIGWGKTNYPAERYAVVLWNHGGGYQGLIEDVTSAGNRLMSLQDVRTALTGAGTIDILDFDMCLMAGYETLEKISGLANFAIFSEETEPAAGDPYTGILQALHASPTADSRAVAAMFVDQYHGYYVQSNDRASTTKSAYDLGQFAAFESALNALAGTLKTNIATTRTILGSAAAASQSYQYPMLKDVGNFLDSLKVRTNDAALLAQIAAVKTQATGGFRVQSQSRNGTDPDAAKLTRSTGLNILMPGNAGEDRLPDDGPLSFAAYQSLMSGKPWTQLLAAYLSTATSSASHDQGDDRFESYLVWDDAATAAGVDVDLWVLEPNGNLYIPWMGVVTPNGRLTGESSDAGSSYEGYLTNRFVQAGRYKFYANLYSDPNNHRTQYDLQYRSSQTAALTSLFDPNLPILSMQTSWKDDPNASITTIESGSYTDLQYVAFVDFAANLAASRQGSMLPKSPIRASSASRSDGEPRITARQLDAVRAYRGKRVSAARQGVRSSVVPVLRMPAGSGR
jgi:hypothetical protein